MHIETFHEKYLVFDEIAKRRSFAKYFNNILWSDKRQIDRKIHYYLIDLW